MKLKRLVVQGFKSFKDRTTVHFDDGITGIVGPNGCGKSNIVDALFWVMGEQSAKHLRGKSMKDLIFAGSAKYNPGSFAQATLVLENTDGKHIHIGNKVSSPSEISLSRKLYRNGETEYRINDEPCRLKDIQEVFMDTGAGAKSYSIIAQGEINKLVQQKPEERRVMIEEVAGITKFKLRKRESLKKIEATQANLNRLSDLQHEIEKNLRALQKQAEKAERARSLKEKIKRNELVVNAHKVYENLKNYRDNKVSINEKTLEVEGWTTRKASLEVSLADERIQKDDKTDKIEELQKEYNDVSRGLAASEERLNSLCNSLTEKEKLIEERNKEIVELNEELKNREAKKEELQTSKNELEEEARQEYDLEASEEKIEMLKEELELKKDQRDNLSTELEESRAAWQELDQTIFRNTSRMEEFSASIQDITEEVEVLETQYSGFNSQVANEREEVLSLQDTESNLSTNEATLKEEVETLSKELRTAEEDFKNLTREHIQTDSRLSSLKEINSSLEGAKDGAAEFIEESGDDSFTFLGTNIKCDEKYTNSVQVLLDDYMDTLISKTGDFEAVKSWALGKEETSLDYLVSTSNEGESEETTERIRLQGFKSVISLSEVLELEGDLANSLKSFLKGFYIVETEEFSTLDNVSAEINFKAICTLDGQHLVKNIGGAKLVSFLGSRDLTQGVVERNNRIVELDARFEELVVELAEKETALETVKELLLTKKTELDDLRELLANTRADYAAKNSALEAKLKNFESGNSRLEILKNRKSEISKQRLTLMESEEDLTKNHEEKKEAIEDTQGRLEELNSDIEDQDSVYMSEKQELLEKQLEAKSFDDRVKSVESQMEDVVGQMERQTTRISATNEMIEKYEQESQSAESEIETLETSNQDTASVLQDKDDVLNMLKDDLGVLLKEMMTREDETKKLAVSINKTEKEIVELGSKLGRYVEEEEQITKNIFEKYKIDLRDALGKFLEYSTEDYEELNDVSSMYFMETEEGQKEILKEEYEFNRRYGQDLKDCEFKFKQYRTEFNRLGEINWQAIEDYERQKLRFDFLKEQELELKQSLEDLENAIGHIDTKSKERFKIAFNEVDERFQKVFPIIFGGGSARLSINGDINDAECGIEIIAQPPGKKMQNINLMSGGEKALTAVSLIFSIFLVKPSPFCLLDEVDAPLDDANVGRFNELLKEMSTDSQFILITHNKKTMELNDTLYGVTMQEPGVSKAVSVQLH